MSRKIRYETIELFYRFNKFHYLVYFTRPEIRHNWCPYPCRMPFDAPFHPQLEWMTDLSIDIIGSVPHRRDKQSIDEDIAGYVILISATCFKLQYFTLHFTWESGREYIAETLRGQSLMATALGAMPVRDRMSIVATAPPGPVGHLGFADLRNAVAPESCWDSTPLDNWHEISMQAQYCEGYTPTMA